MSTPHFDTKLDYALYLAGLGFHVFPCLEKSKLPLIDGYPVRATRDPEQIKKWWTDPVLGFFHDYNIAISTSRFQSDSALWVVDIDVKGAKRGDYEIIKLEAAGYDFPETFEQITPTGGRHLVYVVDEAVRNTASRIAPGLDTRSRGGFIMGAGSETERGRYEIRGPLLVPARAPAWYTRYGSRSDHRGPGASLAPSVPVDQERAVLRAVDYLRHHAPLAIEGNNGDATTYTVACRVKDFGVDKATAAELLLQHWNDRCSPPWQADELTTKVENAYSYGNKPVGADAPEVQFDAVVHESGAYTNGGQSENADNIAGRIRLDGAGSSGDAPGEHPSHPFDKLNAEFAFVIAGGGSHILWETTDAKGAATLEHLSEPAFHKKHAAQFIQAGKKSEPVTEAWMRWKGRRSFDGICFIPGKEAPERFYNLWQGFSVEPLGTSEQLPRECYTALDAFLEHTRDNVCKGDANLTRWLIGYVAHLIQKPWEKPLVALVFRGEKGVGKNAFIERVGFLLGNHFLLASNRRYLVGQFNGHLERLLLFVLDEATWAGDKQAEGTLKDLITGDKHVIEHKGKEPYRVDNRTRVAILGNEDWLAPASHDERRFAVFDVGAGRKQDRGYFQRMREGMELGGYRLLLAYLRNYPLDGLDFNEAPRTEALLDQKHASLEPLEQWWLDCLSAGYIVGGDLGAEWPTRVQTDRFRSALRRYVTERNVRTRISGDVAIGRTLKKIAPGVVKKRARDGQDLMYVYELPPLAECRAAWEAFIGHVMAWEKAE